MAIAIVIVIVIVITMVITMVVDGERRLKIRRR